MFSRFYKGGVSGDSKKAYFEKLHWKHFSFFFFRFIAIIAILEKSLWNDNSRENEMYIKSSQQPQLLKAVANIMLQIMENYQTEVPNRKCKSCNSLMTACAVTAMEINLLKFMTGENTFFFVV